MPSIAGFIQSLLSEDMYATGLIEKMDERITELNAGQLRLLLSYCETKIPGLTNKTVLDAYSKLLRKATTEADRRHEKEVKGERERLRQLKAAHAGVNAKAWDTSHASLDRELAKFQKFLKKKARAAAEEEVVQESMEKLHVQLMAIPARRVTADSRRHVWWGIGGILALVVSPIVLLCVLPVGLWLAIGVTVATLILAGFSGCIGVVRGVVVPPTLDDDAIEEETRKRATQKLKGYRAEVRRNYEQFEQAFNADMKWRDEWAADRRLERKKERRKNNTKKQQQRQPTQGAENRARIAPEGEDDVEQGFSSTQNMEPTPDEEQVWLGRIGLCSNESPVGAEETGGPIMAGVSDVSVCPRSRDGSSLVLPPGDNEDPAVSAEMHAFLRETDGGIPVDECSAACKNESTAGPRAA